MRLSRPIKSRAAKLAVLIGLVAAVLPGALWAQSSTSGGIESSSASGPIRLRQPQGERPQAERPAQPAPERDPDEADTRPSTEPQRDRRDEARYEPTEFELYVQRVTENRKLRRFGSDMIEMRVLEGADAASHANPVPSDYPISSGDELILTLWGSVDADLRLVVDRTGRIHIPRVGSVMVAGAKYGELHDLIDTQAKRTFKNFRLSVSLGQLRGVRVFVTGFVRRPGTYAVDSLTSVSSVLFAKAQGPSGSGSFRDVQLRRGGRTIANLDMYELMLTGRKEGDQLLRAGDIIHVGPVGNQVALVGSVNKPAIFELKPGETVGDLLNMGGGLNSVADRTRLAVERIEERSDRRIRQLSLPADAATPLVAGDVVRAFSAVDAVLPVERQNKRVSIEGEVARPGVYILPPSSSVADAVAKAGGLTSNAFLFGTEFTRQSVRATQQANYDRALRDLELDLSKRATAQSARTAEEATTQRLQQSATELLLERMRAAKPSGRIVLQLSPEAVALPDLALEDGDRIYVPGRPTTVGVFGSVYNAGSYLHQQSKSLGDYLLLAGNTTRGADDKSVFVIRANGSVVSVRQKSDGWFGNSERDLRTVQALPGDTIFVPEEVNKTTFVQSAKDWTQILYQFGLGIAAFTTITK